MPVEKEFPKVYSPQDIELRWSRFWVERELYRPSDDASRARFCLVIPPPNITGVLHIGHMLEHTEIDALMRWHRMRGEDVLWLPGTDHASISTQMIVERELGREALPDREDSAASRAAWQREGQRRRIEMGREKFLERCWEWKEQSGGTIRKQMERLGASCDWTRERFTMDPAYSRAVTEVFVRLYEEGLIYRGKYIVNWCPRCGTALSDLEVNHEERASKLWFIRYPYEDGSGFLTVATTRPETMLGDTAVAVNPADERYRAVVGRKVVLPLLKRTLPIVADDFVDPEFGTGAVKVTPAHDPNDFEIARRQNLPRVKVIDARGRMTSEAGPYRDLDRFEARQRVLSDLAKEKLLENEQDYALSVGTCSRCKTVVEPLLSEQWFMKMKPLAGPAIRAVEQDLIKITPENYKKICLDWMKNIHDWCISRQLWWGHRIPAWTCGACGELMVAREAPATCRKCGKPDPRPDDDVLDTWFSSGLWPFATLGWPEDTADLRRFYPNDLMIMGFDILFFWGARMIMLGQKLMKDVPFVELHIHALVRDAERQKMSKTKGNVIDPLEVTEQYGTDAVRFALAISAAPGTDIAFSYDKIESYRAFANKIWNAGRFILMNLEKLPEAARNDLGRALEPKESAFVPEPTPETLALADRWIFSRLAAVTHEINEALATYRFHEAAFTVYHFFWHEFCDWYVEWLKPEITRPHDGLQAPAAWINLVRTFQAALHLLHPFMPFITEELWHRLPRREGDVSISLAAFGLVSDAAVDRAAEARFSVVRDLIVGLRDEKADWGLQRERPPALLASFERELLDFFRAHEARILSLAGVRTIQYFPGRELPPEMSSEKRLIQLGEEQADALDIPLLMTDDAGRPVHGQVRFECAVVGGAHADGAAERARLERERVKIEKSVAQAERQLSNENFTSRAPADVVAGVKRQRGELAAQLAKITESLAKLEGSAKNRGEA